MTETQTRLADDPQMPVAGSMVGDRYEVRSVLGEGGFAVVYRAFDARTKAEVAVKVLDPLMSRRREFASRFMREVETVSKLRHHNTISVYDAGETPNGCLYLVMELLDGKPLDTILEEEGKLSPPRVRHIATQILKSLQEAHSKGIIHRDLKPANVFLADVAGEDDYVKVLDFGIAKSVDESQNSALTATGQVMCSPHYVAPERVKEHLTVPASDLYSLGIMLIELLDGRPPYEAESPMMLAVKHLTAEPVPFGPESSVAPFAEVIQRAVNKPLDGRYTSAEEMAAALKSAPTTPARLTSSIATPSAVAETVAVSNVTTDTDVNFAPQSGSKRMVMAALSLFVLVAAIAGIVFVGSGNDAPAVDGASTAATAAAVADNEEEAAAAPEAAPPPANPAEGLEAATAAIQTALMAAERDQAISGARQVSADGAAALAELEEAAAREREEEEARRAEESRRAAEASRRARARREAARAAAPEPAAEPAARSRRARSGTRPTRSRRADAQRGDPPRPRAAPRRRAIRTNLAPR